MNYARVYADSGGESHVEHVDVPLAAQDFAPPAPPLNISTPTPAAQSVFVMAPPGWYGDWHPAPRRQYYVNLAGDVEIQASDGAVLRLSSGDVALLEDVTGKGHTTRVMGDIEVRGMFVQLSD